MIRILFLALLFLPLFADARCQSAKPERFASFLQAFGQDKRFALARTEYPLRSLRRENEDPDQDEPVTVEQRISRLDDAKEPALAAYARSNGLEMKTVLLQARNAAVQVGKPDTDWLLTYHFVRKGRCWYLRRIEDHSL